MDDTPTNPPAPPTPPRRKAATGTRKTTRATPPKATAPVSEGSAKAPAKKPAAPRKPPVRKPASTAKPSTVARARTVVKSAAAKVTDTASIAALKGADRTASALDTVAHSAPAKLVADTRERMGDRNFFAALIGGVAALGAAVGGIFYAMRDGNPDKPDGKKPEA